MELHSKRIGMIVPSVKKLDFNTHLVIHWSMYSPVVLLQLTQAQWQKVLDAACCTILSCMSNKFCDSYVLSESSLFVYRHKLLLKTCGTTTLLHVIPLMLEHAERLGMNISYCFFSRKALTFPHAQKHPHRCATDEVSVYAKNQANFANRKRHREPWCLMVRNCIRG